MNIKFYIKSSPNNKILFEGTLEGMLKLTKSNSFKDYIQYFRNHFLKEMVKKTKFKIEVSNCTNIDLLDIIQNQYITDNFHIEHLRKVSKKTLKINKKTKYNYDEIEWIEYEKMVVTKRFDLIDDIVDISEYWRYQEICTLIDILNIFVNRYDKRFLK